VFVSGGALVSKTPTLDTSRFPYMPPMAGGGWPSAYAEIYRRQLWVYVVVSKRARATARLPLPVYAHGDLDRPKVPKHPMARLLNAPNPGLSSFNLWKWTSATYDIYGQTFWFKGRTGGRVTGLFPLHPRAMTLNDATGQWTFDNGKLVLRDIDPNDLVVFRDFDPEKLDQGMSALEPLRATLENEWSARTATSSFWARGARPGMALVHKNNLSEAAQKRLKAQMDSVSAGADKTGTTLVLEEGMEPHKMTLTAEEAQYIDTRKLNREEVCAAYDMPPPAVHILDRATFNNITEQFRSVYRDTMAPHLRGFEAALELDLRRVEWPSDEIYSEFLMDEVLRGDFEQRQDALNKANHMTIAEKRKVENLPFLEGTDRIFLNTATLPLDAIDARADAVTQRVAAGLSQEGLPRTVARSVAGRLSWQADLGDVEPKALVAGIGDHAGLVLQALAVERARGGTPDDLKNRIHAMVQEEQ
jgi:HK97 family phage portal protein